MRLLVVLNPSSRDFEAVRRWPELAPRLQRAAEVDLLETSPDDAETRRRLDSALGRRPERVVAVGGDGTVHLVVNAVLASGQPPPQLAVIPFGTANDVAKSLHLPLDALDELADVAVGSHLGRLDVGRVVASTDGRSQARWFVDSVTIGMDADVLASRSRYRDLPGYFAYVAALAERAVEQQSLDVRLVVDGEVTDTRAFNLIVNNVPFYAGELEMPGSSGDDGLLDVYLFNRREYTSKLLSFAIKTADVFELGFHELVEDLTRNQRESHSRDIRVRLASPRQAQVDGEVLGPADELHCTVDAQLAVTLP